MKTFSNVFIIPNTFKSFKFKSSWTSRTILVFLIFFVFCFSYHISTVNFHNVVFLLTDNINTIYSRLTKIVKESIIKFRPFFQSAKKFLIFFSFYTFPKLMLSQMSLPLTLMYKFLSPLSTAPSSLLLSTSSISVL